ncbi:hypothetical protein J8273_6046 [Carpediemonas membranifera]|uniref:Uncharacterized protein n=1 Tax=Carpediemonas membranifera TaxID=201153 RepID=A0A8J6AS04_9EUKA|nr:hypothetical protein J8273_6046 [Carpediemonas membranifera]|eukprot:KAG9392578.1 hypothetical protein J8273_6046 [Carpediemonas membranifera]
MSKLRSMFPTGIERCSFSILWYFVSWTEETAPDSNLTRPTPLFVVYGMDDIERVHIDGTEESHSEPSAHISEEAFREQTSFVATNIFNQQEFAMSPVVHDAKVQTSQQVRVALSQDATVTHTNLESVDWHETTLADLMLQLQAEWANRGRPKAVADAIAAMISGKASTQVGVGVEESSSDTEIDDDHANMKAEVNDMSLPGPARGQTRPAEEAPDSEADPAVDPTTGSTAPEPEPAIKPTPVDPDPTDPVAPTPAPLSESIPGPTPTRSTVSLPLPASDHGGRGRGHASMFAGVVVLSSGQQNRTDPDHERGGSERVALVDACLALHRERVTEEDPRHPRVARPEVREQLGDIVPHRRLNNFPAQ